MLKYVFYRGFIVCFCFTGVLTHDIPVFIVYMLRSEMTSIKTISFSFHCIALADLNVKRLGQI